MHPIRYTGYIGIIASIPGYISNAVSALYEDLSSIVQGPIFMIVRDHCLLQVCGG